MKRFRDVLIGFCLAFFLVLGLSITGYARQETPNPSPSPGDTLETLGEGFPVTLDGRVLFLARHGIGSFTPEVRARAITDRIERIARDESLSTKDLTIRVDPDDRSPSIVLGDKVILTVTPQDAKLYRRTQIDEAKLTLQEIKTAIDRYRIDRQPDNLLRNAISTAIATVILFVTIAVIVLLSRRIVPALRRMIVSLIPGWRIQSFEILSPVRIENIFLWIFKFLRLLVILTLVFFYLTFVLRLFPWTRQFGDKFLTTFLDTMDLVAKQIALYLPNLFIVAIIAAITYYLLKTIRPFFTAIERGNLRVQGFYPDWAGATYNILKLLIIALAAILAFPYLPGFYSPAFQGISVFLGVLFSLGSTSAIANIVGGVILIYTRAFQLRDVISIGDVTGDVIEKTLLVTRIRTPTNRIITIPNSALLNTNVVNLSVSYREFDQPLILQTTITLGYDVPWRKVHAVLIDAALATEHILADPAPFVLQSSLDDFSVAYQLNAYTDQPRLFPIIYSELHQNMQDKCNEVGIEILSPNYLALRDGNHSTIPENYLPKDYQTPTFGINSGNRNG
ncbi:mechanosensitive ion channel family protein [Gloeothece verrucosa]|uniref:MscS Mechanosensitive ion channel n=1 Tax=Gloeothece verrucosa (strain PCC 7822) TaxID=497965 RepID=E0U7M5_GLOV7|nr:mechanosensitive ion channel family protein [Gloeothece verrucosa]ADN14837.1 MscS Mechanosensitive ion channel [Gloeothece verrucosa PCC 7822]